MRSQRGRPNPKRREKSLVFVVDDDPWICRGVERLLRTRGLCAETFASGEAFLRRNLPERPSCLILDLWMPGLSGLEVLAALGRTDRGLPVIFMTAQGDVPSSVAAMKAGALEFLEKPFEDEDLLTAVDGALARDRLRLRERRRILEARRRLATLTPRERELLSFVVEGLPNKETASRLGISEKTVKVHRARVFEKLGASSLPDLVRAAARVGIHGVGGATDGRRTELESRPVLRRGHR